MDLISTSSIFSPVMPPPSSCAIHPGCPLACDSEPGPLPAVTSLAQLQPTTLDRSAHVPRVASFAQVKLVGELVEGGHSTNRVFEAGDVDKPVPGISEEDMKGSPTSQASFEAESEKDNERHVLTAQVAQHICRENRWRKSRIC